MRRTATLLLALAASGCTLTVNSILEVDMQLPAGARPWASVSVTRGRIPPPCTPGGPDECFSPVLVNSGARVFLIDGTEEDLCAGGPRSCNVRFSVSSEDASLEALYVRVDLCEQMDCLSTNDAFPPYYLFEIERPFYQGERTRWSPNRDPFDLGITRDPQPADREERRYPTVHRCEIEGCSEGNVIDDPVLGWCFGPPLGGSCGGCGVDEYCSGTTCVPCDDVNCRQLHFCEQ